MRLWTWDDSIGLARSFYIRHAHAWEDLINSHSQCVVLSCLEANFDNSGDEIENSFIDAQMEFDRISPRLDFFKSKEKITNIFSVEDED